MAAKKEKNIETGKMFISKESFNQLRALFEKQRNEIRFLRNENKQLREKAVKIYLQNENPLCNIIAIQQ
jgi:hypothetical protein